MCEAMCKVYLPTRGLAIYATTRWRLLPIRCPKSSAARTPPPTERLPNVELLPPDGLASGWPSRPARPTVYSIQYTVYSSRPRLAGQRIHSPDRFTRGCHFHVIRYRVSFLRPWGTGSCPRSTKHACTLPPRLFEPRAQETWQALRRRSSCTRSRPSL